MFKNLLSSMLFGICNGLRPVASNHGISVGQFALSQISTYKVMWGNSSTLINVITLDTKINIFTLELRDQQGRLIQLNDSNYDLSFLLEIYEEQIVVTENRRSLVPENTPHCQSPLTILLFQMIQKNHQIWMKF